MTPSGFQRAIYDLGWIALAQRALGLRPADAHALRCLVRHPGRPVSHDALALDYAQSGLCSGSSNGVKIRVQRARRALTQVGCAGVIRAVPGEGAYVVEPSGARRIEAALLSACGVQLEPEQDFRGESE